ncbi:MAG: sigma 54-interacting transcriptional regulator [bacterium]
MYQAEGLIQVFAVTEKRDALEKAFYDFVQKDLHVSQDTIAKLKFKMEGPDAILEFYRLAIGMNRKGEFNNRGPEFHSALTEAREACSTGAYFSRLHQRGLWLSEKVRIELNLQKNAITPETVVTDLAQKIFGDLQDNKALIAARNSDCEKFIQKLHERNIGELIFVDLDQTGGNRLCEQYRGTKVTVSRLDEVMPKVDLLLLFDENFENVFHNEQIVKVMNLRKNAPFLYVSYYDEILSEQTKKRNGLNIYNMYYYKKSDLEKIVDSNLQAHQKVTDVVDKLLEREIQNFISWVQSNERYRFGNIIGKSESMQKILELVARIAQTNISVLIDGESGTGKEMVACAIHEHSTRADNPFIVVNCGAMPENLLESELFGHVRGAFTGATANKKGLFETANHGTIFLDEIGETSLAMQVKLLRFLQEGEIKPVGSNQIIKLDVRLITATNKNLEKMVEEGTFRQDLYYRLNVIQITIPPLKDRPEDILPLAEFFIKKYASKVNKAVYGLNDDAARLLRKYPWPGNVRELENVIERAMALSTQKILTREDLPPTVVNSRAVALSRNRSQTLTLKELEKIHIAEALEVHNWNYDLVAKVLGIGRTTLWRKMKEYDISNV